MYIYKHNNEPQCIARNARIELVTTDMNFIIFLADYDNSKLSGKLYILDFNYNKKFIDKDVYTGVSFLDDQDNTYRILYIKRDKEKNSRLCDIYIYDSKNIITNIDRDIYYDFKFFMEKNNRLKFIYFKPNDEELYLDDGAICIYEDNKKIKKFRNTNWSYTVLRDTDDSLKLVYYSVKNNNTFYDLKDINIYREIGESEIIKNVKDIRLFRTMEDSLIFTAFRPEREMNFSEVGEFVLYSEDESIFYIKDVLGGSIKIFLLSSEETIEVRGYGSIRNIDEGDSFRIICFNPTIYNEELDFMIGNIYVYEKKELCLTIENVCEKYLVNRDGTKIVYYFLNNKKKVDMWIYDYKTNKEYLIVDNVNYEDIKYEDFFQRDSDLNHDLIKNKLGCIDSKKISTIKFPSVRVNKYANKDTFTFYLRNQSTKLYYVACEVAKRAHEYRLLENEFSDDTSINHIAIFKKEQLKDVGLMYYILSRNIVNGSICLGYNIYDIAVSNIEEHCSYIGNNPYMDAMRCYRDANTNLLFNTERLSKNEFQKRKNLEHVAEMIISDLMKRYNFNKETQLANYLREKYILPYSVEFNEIGNALIAYGIIYGDYKDKFKEEYNDIYKQLVIDNKVPAKWKSENDLFKLVNEEFSDAQMHYNPEWLGRQHYDIYIPSEKIAFEYQGIQHYTSVDYFGGTDGFMKRIELDTRKRKLSEENNVRLIEWKFDEPITKVILRKKLRSFNINI